jgi:ABC-type nitrate/sulfonate/bicarbonate transport system permease component
MTIALDTSAAQTVSFAERLEKNRRTIISTTSVGVFLLAWQFLPMLGIVDIRLTSTPARVIATAIELIPTADFANDLWVSSVEFFVGMALAIGVGIPLGLVLGTSRTARLFIDPPLMAIYATPRLALLPIIIVWLGIGLTSKIAVVFLGAVFYVLINTMAGVTDTDQRLVRAAKSFGATKYDIFTRIILPSALPAVMIGIRLGIGRGVLGVIVGEMFSSEAGLGNKIMTYGEAVRIDHLLVYTLFVSLCGYLMTTGARLMEERLRSWRPQA